MMTNQKRLLHIFSTFAVGGPQIRFAQMADHLGSDLHHRIVALDGRYECLDRIAGSASVEVLTAPCADRNLLGRLKSYNAFLRHQKPDLLMTYNWGSIEWAMANTWISHHRHFHFEDGFGAEEADNQLRRRIWLRRLALQGAERVIVPSRTLLRLASDRWRLPEKQVAYVPNGIDLRQFDEESGSCDETSRHVDGAGIVFVTVTALRPEKNVAGTLRAYGKARESVPKSRLIIIGDGPERTAIEKLAEHLEISDEVQITGYIPRPASQLGTIDVYILSSLTEQMPLSLLEAMAARLPVAAFDVGDVKNMLASSNCPYVCEPQNDEALARAMIRLASDPALRRRLGDDNRARVADRYQFDSMVEHHKRLICCDNMS